ncbi:MAG: hypothetical protein NZ839_04265, partial [Endomicrobia bacterium]|nr:hypothetical protein [Endomicrobiia bacterium]
FTTTTSTFVSADKDDYLGKILSYFVSNKILPEDIEYENTINISTGVINTSFVQLLDGQFVINEGSSTLKFDELKRLFFGFGRREIIRLLLIKQKSSTEVSIKTLVDLRKKNKSMKDIAKQYNIDYINDIWLPSEKIYNHLFEVKAE